MSQGEFTRRIQEMRQRIVIMQHLASPRHDSTLQVSSLLLAEAFEKLDTALEELQVVEEDLLAARDSAEAERQRYQDLFEFAPDGYLVTGREGKIQEANYTAARLLNIPSQLLVGKLLINFFLGEERRGFRTQLTRLQEISRLEWEAHLKPHSTKNSSEAKVFDAALTAIAIHSGLEHSPVVALRWSIRNITQRKQLEAQLVHNAFHDALTGLPNRHLFMDRLGQAVEHAKRHGAPSGSYLFAVLFLDLDRFKLINDSLGHAAGDQLLISVARRLEACLRPSDTAARLGGDEFAILLEDITDVSDAIRVAERIQAQLALPFNLAASQGTLEARPCEVFTFASIGIALNDESHNRPEDLLRDADTAMYRAKGRNGPGLQARCQIFNPEMYTHAVAGLQLQKDLRRAIERQEFRVHYQPIVSLLSGKITGFEALVRWQHPSRGLLAPVEFIRVAEEIGLSLPIDWWVLRQACQQLRQWQARHPAAAVHSADTLPLAIGVNFCSRQFAQSHLIEQLGEILRETGLDSRSLKLEITESILMENADSIAAILLQLQALGVQVQIDDFGTGYSSLSYLNRFAVNALKIDQSLIKMTIQNQNLEIVRTIASLADSLGMDVIAEGVETAEQVAQLRGLKCRYAQGYYFSEPLDSEAAGALVRELAQNPNRDRMRA